MKPLPKKAFAWNFAGSMIFSLLSIILPIFVKRLTDLTTANDFVIAYAYAQTLMAVGYFEVRTFQVTDFSDRFSFKTYHSFRLMTVGLMLVCGIACVLITGATGQKAWMILLLCLLKALDTLADVYECEYQKREELALVGQSLTIRTVLSCLVFVLMLLVADIPKALILACVSSFLCILFFNRPKRKKLPEAGDGKGTVPELFVSCLLLAAGAFLCIYILNAVKYGVDKYCSSENYAFSALFMPANVINLFAVVLFRPFLTGLCAQYGEGRIRDFVKSLGLFSLGIAGLTLVCLLGAALLGLPVLSALYAVDLSGQKGVLLLMITGGGFNAAGILLYYGLTIMRKPVSIFVVYVLTFAASLFLPDALIKTGGLFGAATAFVILLALQWLLTLLALGINLILCSKRREK